MYNQTRTDLLNYLNNNKIEYTSVGNHTIQVNLTVTKEKLNIYTMNRIEQLIEDRYPGQLNEILNKIDILSKEYDEEQFLEEDILENILMELDII